MGRLGCWRDPGFVRVQLKPSAFQELPNAVAPLGKHRRVVVKQRKVVDITQIGRAQHFGDEMIEAIEVEVGEKLAGQVADRQAAPPLVGREQVVAVIVKLDRLLGIRAVDDQVHQRQRVRSQATR
jgi:hypothetical protein